jgi:mediator of RNA polymerase II transcription subunit 14
MLLLLCQVIEYRLATTTLPTQMRKNRIENGRVKFTVDHEFEATLTLMGDGPNVPWSLLDINILVEDKETGDGKSLVHQFQVQFIHELLQSRLRDCDNPLLELYTVLHTFSQSLQLEVLHSQTKRLCQERLGELIRVEEYVTGRSLTISYWKDLASRELKSDLGYRVTAQVCTSHAGGSDVIGKPLQILHNPPLSTKDSEMAEQSIRSDHLSLEKLLTHTIYMRTRTRLSELKVELQPKLGHQQADCVVQGSPPVLHLPILSPCLRSEQLLITVDTRTGSLQAHIPQVMTS